jgi:hypothetical protein
MHETSVAALSEGEEETAESVRRLEKWKAKLSKPYTIAPFTIASLGTQVAVDLGRMIHTLSSEGNAADQFVGYAVLVKVFDGNPDTWIQWLREKGGTDQLLHDLPFAFWVKEQAETDPDFMNRVRWLVNELAAEP